MLTWVCFLSSFFLGAVQVQASAAELRPTSMQVCYAYFSYISDLGFTYAINLGRAWVDEQINTTSRYVEGFGLMDLPQRKEVLNEFLDSGCRVVVVGTGSAQDLAWDFAQRHPQVRFVCLSCIPKPEIPNYAAVNIVLEQAGYIAGRVAALQENVKSIGYVASTYVGPSYRHINSLALGALSARPNITLKITHTGSWYSPRKEQIAAMRLIQQHGVDLLAYDSDSTRVIEIAQMMGKQSVAIKVDGTGKFGESNLLSRVYVWQTPLKETIGAAFNLTNWTEHRRDNEKVGFEKQAVSIGTISTAISVPSRIWAKQMIRQFEFGDNVTFCIGSQGRKAFCPTDANLASAVLGGVAPTHIYPCNLSGTGGLVMPENGNCLSDDQRQTMSWLVHEFEDLGLIDVPDQCPPGTRMDYSGETLCMPCAPGHISVVIDAASCEACPAGTYAVDSVECQECPVGSFSNTSGSTGCALCPAGTYASQSGQMQCTACGLGFFTGIAGQATCERCPLGSYNDGSSDHSSCLQCADGKITELRGASDAKECICPGGAYQDKAGVCRACPTGMACDPGSDIRNLPPASLCATSSCAFPRALPKYMTLPEAPLKVYACMDDEACPGGSADAVSRCAAHRAADEVACGLCEDGAFLTRDDNCEDCGGDSDVLIFVVVILGILLALIVVPLAVNRDMLLQSDGVASLVILVGLLLTSIQIIQVFDQVSLEWVDPVQGVTKFLSIFSLDLRLLKTECHVPVTPTSRLVGRQVIALACLPIVYAIVTLKKLIKVGLKVSVWAEGGNAAGTLFSVFYISVVTSAITPFVCYPHPSDSEAGFSMVSDPAVLCWEGDERHGRLVAVAVTSFLLVPVVFLAVCITAVLKYPKVMAAHSENQHLWLNTYRFLFFRFKPDAYFYGLVNLMRNLLICVLPAAIPGDAVGMQIFLLFALLLGFSMIQVAVQPWRTHLANVVDGLTSIVLVLILVTGLLATDVDESKAGLRVLSTLVLLVGMLGLVLGAANGARDNFPKVHYGFFLCHHKGAAAAQARLLQILISQRLSRSCCLDSDIMKDLATLLEILKTAVSHFVVYLTQETLTQPWCVSEIVIAKEAKLPFTKIHHPSYEAPRDYQLEDADNGFLAPGLKFADFNMDGARVSECLRWISVEELSTIIIPPESQAVQGLHVFHDIVSRLGGQKKTSGKISASSRWERADTLIISSDPEDLEATAASGIILSRIQAAAAAIIDGEVLVMADLGQCLSETHLLQCVSGARAAVIVLTEHSLHSLQQLHVIVAATAGAIGLIAVCTPAFTFPNDAYYDYVLTGMRMPQGDDLRKVMKAFFDQIALPLSTHACKAILQAECQQIMSRVPRERTSSQRSEGVLSLQLPTPVHHGVSARRELLRRRTGSTIAEPEKHLHAADEDDDDDSDDDDHHDLAHDHHQQALSPPKKSYNYFVFDL